MTKKEFAIFASALRTYYTKEQILPNDQAMELWFMQLKDIPYDAAQEMLNKWVANNKWSPTIAEIRQQVEATAYERKLQAIVFKAQGLLMDDEQRKLEVKP